MRPILLICLIFLTLTGCAVAHLQAEQPIALLTAIRPPTGGSEDTPAKRMVAATLLALDNDQRRGFNSLLDTLKRHQTQLRPLVQQYQGQMRQAFVSGSFGAANMQARWQSLAGAGEARNAAEAAVQLSGFWQSLNQWQRQQIEKRFKEIEAKVRESTAKALGPLRQRQLERLRALIPALGLDAAQQNALLATALDPREIQTRQSAIRKEVDAMIRQLKSSDHSIRSLQNVLTPLYRNQRHWQAQLQRLEQLHAKLTPAQRAKLITSLK